MFLRGGFNPRRRRTGVCALVNRAGTRWVRPAQLVRFACGDFAWEGARGISWPEAVRFQDQFYISTWRYGLPQSRWPR